MLDIGVQHKAAGPDRATFNITVSWIYCTMWSNLCVLWSAGDCYKQGNFHHFLGKFFSHLYA